MRFVLPILLVCSALSIDAQPTRLRMIAGAVDPIPTMYVDGSLGANCLTTYDPSSRTCGLGSAEAYNTVAGAAAAVAAGDIVSVRAGTYSWGTSTAVTISADGTSSNRITFMGHSGENVIFKGPYDVDTDGDGIRDWDENDGMGEAVGPAGSALMLTVSGDYVTLKRFTISWGYEAIEVNLATNAIVEEVKCHDTWIGCFKIGDGGNSHTFRYNATYRVRHQSGFFIDVDQLSQVSLQNVWYRNLSFKHGRQLPNDAQVLPITGDPVGGGNSDSFGVSKDCSDLPFFEMPSDPVSLCRQQVYQENIGWQSVDDVWDTSMGSSYLIANIGYDAGPEGNRGFKMLRDQLGMQFSGNLIIGSNPASVNSIQRDYEPRFNDQAALGTFGTMFHNFGTRATSFGIVAGCPVGETDRCIIRNNLMYGNGAIEYSITDTTNSNNYNGDVSGTPDLADATFDPASTIAAAETCLANAPHTVTIQSCWKPGYDAFYNAYKPAPAGNVVDAGVVESGYHCTLADDNGQNPASACRHWMGAAPDQGPFELGITGNPDKSQCVLVGSC